MRARSLKPSIFKNELLAVADPLYTVIFEGLWCAADREGRMEDRPARLHIEINPGRAYDTTERALAWLAENAFIIRYVVRGSRYICIPAFLKHQRPHQNEKPSVIPAPELATKVRRGLQPRSKATCDQGNKHFALTPDSGLLTPDSSPPERGAQPAADALPPFDPKKIAGLDQEAWCLWIEHRRAIKKPIRPHSLTDAAEQLAKLGDQQLAEVKRARAGGWQGLHPEKTNGAERQPARRVHLRTADEIEAEERIRAAG